MRIAEDETCDCQALVYKIYEWEHSRRLEVGKWLLAVAAALVATVITLAAKGEPAPLPYYVLPVATLGAGLAAMSGIVTIWSARVISVNLARTTALVARFVAIRTFLSRVRKDEGL